MSYKKILLINKSLVIGGIETVLLTQYQKFKSEGHLVDILLFNKNEDYNLEDKSDIFYFDEFKSIKSFFKQQEKHTKYDVIICHAQSKTICSKVKSINNMNTVFVLHGIHSDRLLNKNIISKFFKKKKIQFLYNNTNIVTVSNTVKKDIESIGVVAKKIKTIYNPFDIEKIKKLAKSNKDEILKRPYIIWVGRISEIKNLPLLIDIYKFLSHKYDLVIVGDGPDNIKHKIKEKTNAIDIKNKVHFLGFQENPYTYIKDAAAMIITSKNEGLSMVAIESLILNTPVFSVNIPVLEEVLSKYYPSGLLLSKKPQEMAKYIIDNINTPINTKKIINELSSEISNRLYMDFFDK